MKRAALPLNALRVFDAAARHLSFKKAADELSVTPAAVSQQIRTLEEVLGMPLFRRSARSLILTDQAQAALPALRQGFECIEEAVALMQAGHGNGPLVISVSPSFASKWLVPRLGRFYQEERDAVVRIIATMELSDFQREEVDLAIRYGAGDYPGLYSEILMREEVFPVCAPALVDGDSAIREPGDLSRVPLIHDESSLDDESCPTWAMWLKAAGLGVEEGQPALHFNQTSLAIEAAIAGRGVALAKRTMAAQDLKAGRLVRPFSHAYPVDFAHYLVCPQAKKDQPRVARFMSWLRTEAGHDWAWEI
ncbi:MAG: transcriptional regulator GcvA [Rhodothalassiaceae bacterium]